MSISFEELEVVVLGGLVMDVLVDVERLPDWNKATPAKNLTFRCGGKGFNQAIAARRLGAKVKVIGAVGQDEFGARILGELEDNKIDTKAISLIPNATTPITIVFLNQGKTSFVGWKNAEKVPVNSDMVCKHQDIIQNADVLLTTLEVSPKGIAAALDIAAREDTLTVLNPAPPLEVPPYNLSDLRLELVDLLIPNEWEARELAGSAINMTSKSIKEPRSENNLHHSVSPRMPLSPRSIPVI